ncbi:RNA pseudouridine synthase [Lactobacillus helveticus]|uniref:RNA pseudouridine synthase n=1 Tax=Lactobacillus helveticus TaxID=1587 RepID=UPI001C26F483|nr:RNA pseudouridine synthase [Lactobacillus helveticus]
MCGLSIVNYLTICYYNHKKVHQLIKKRIIVVNGRTVRTPKEKVAETDEVTINGGKTAYQKCHYFLMNKPKGVLSTTENRSQRTVISLLDPQDRYQGIVPVGRLDKDTTDLLLLTNDGQLNHELLAPNKHVAKIYHAKIAGVADSNTVKTFATGMTLGDGTKLKTVTFNVLKQDIENGSSEIEIEISEGKYHQIKRMFSAVGMEVVELERVSMGKLRLPDDLKRGEYVEIDVDEIK